MWLKLARGHLENHVASPLRILSFLGNQESKPFILQVRKPGPRGKVTGSRSSHLGTRFAVHSIRALKKENFLLLGFVLELLRGKLCWQKFGWISALGLILFGRKKDLSHTHFVSRRQWNEGGKLSAFSKD